MGSQASTYPQSGGGHTLNPACILTVLHSRHQKSTFVLQDNIKVWLEKGIVSGMATTSTKQNTCSPVWKESFKL